MSQVKFQGNAGGSGSVTIQSPNTNSAYTQTLTAGTGTIPVTSSGGIALITGAPIYENTQTVGTSYSITSGSSAMSAGPITLSSGVTVTLPSGSRWVIV